MGMRRREGDGEERSGDEEKRGGKRREGDEEERGGWGG